MTAWYILSGALTNRIEIRLEKIMKKVAGMLMVMIVNGLSYAACDTPDMVLDTIELQMAAKQWVNTQTALLSVDINATLSDTDLVKTRSDIMEKLAKIAPGDWHLIRFDRSQDSSGLEKLYVQAQVRISQTQLTNLYQNAKAVTKPGATYEVSSIEFKPSLEEIQQVRNQLREKLYQQTNDELARVNKVYSTQHYTLYHINFFEGDNVPVMPMKRLQAAEINAMAAPMIATPPLTVSNELIMTALVQLASVRPPVGVK